MLGVQTLKRWLGYATPETKPAKGGAAQPAARLDNARTGHENANHWAAADSLGPNATYNPVDRRTVRDRARYEVANNSFAYGAANAYADDAIGSGPRLQVLLPDVETGELVGVTSNDRVAEMERLAEERDAAARKVEQSWQAWADETGLATTLRLLCRSGVVDGEAFASPTTDPALRHPVKLRLRPFECDRVCDPNYFGTTDPLNVDGIKFDGWGNPVGYTVLRQHPGEQVSHGAREFDVLPASQVFHWFRQDRPGQARGVSWLCPALGLFAVLRRYTLAVLLGAETSANVAAVLETDLPAGQDDPTPIKAMSEFELPRNSAVALPGGAKLKQVEANPHTAQFGDFRTQILTEIGRVLDMPLARISGSAMGYNFSQARIDHTGYHRGLWLIRDLLRRLIVDRLYRLWLTEATLAGEIPDGLPPFDRWEHEWQWDGFDSFDPLKEANAATALLAANMTDLAELCAARGRRWDQVLRQRAREQKLAKKLGLVPATVPATAPAAAPPAAVEDEEDAVPAGGRDDEEESREV